LARPYFNRLHVLSVAATNLDLCHLCGVAWYLECGPQHVPTLEREQFNSLEAIGGVVAEDEALAGLDDKTRDKLIA
jgi:hypothetical protein